MDATSAVKKEWSKKGALQNTIAKLFLCVCCVWFFFFFLFFSSVFVVQATTRCWVLQRTQKLQRSRRPITSWLDSIILTRVKLQKQKRSSSYFNFVQMSKLLLF